MKAAILGGTGVYSIEGINTVEQIVETEFGSVNAMKGTGQWENLYFIFRHGTDHTISPHKTNCRANIQALRNLGADHVGMTGATETALAREAGLHYAAIAYSINWAAGIQKDLEFISNEKMMEVKIIITEIALKVLFSELVSCACKAT